MENSPDEVWKMENSKVTQETGAAPACRICLAEAVTRIPVRALRPQTVRRYIFGEKATADVPLCGICAMLHCEETIAGDGPARRWRTEHTVEKKARPVGASERSYEYAMALLCALEGSGYRLFLRSDGKQIILSHEDGLDNQTRRQVERYRREITNIIIFRLWEETRENL